MQTCNDQIRLGLAAALLTFAVSGSALAFDPEKTFKVDEEPRTILRYGFKALKNGQMEEAIGAFRFGAARNDLASQWKLARMLQTGAGLPQDDLAAYNLFAKISDRFAERFPAPQDRAFVASAIVQLARYSQIGIKGTRIRVNPRRAEDHYYRAAALYHDREAQYQLGMMYRRGDLGIKQPRSAARWFGLSARKGHADAQAQLGEMLFYGEGVRRSPVRGLVFMTKATANSARRGVKSIRKMRREAFAKASEAQRQAARRIIAGLKLRSDEETKSFGLELETPTGELSSASQTD